MIDIDTLKVAVVHEWLSAKAGSELVFEHLAQAFPNADLFALTRDPMVPFVPDGRAIRTSLLQSVPCLRSRRDLTLPLMPLAWKSIQDRGEYDLVVTSAHAFAREFPVGEARHVSYVHAPMRYAWSPELDPRTAGNSSVHSAARRILRWADRRSVPSVHQFVANSSEVADRIATFYGRQATIVHPPVVVDDLFQVETRRSGYALALSRWISYKRLDIAIEACCLAKVPLVVAGSGPEEFRLRALAQRLGGDVQFVRQPSREALADLMAGASVFVFPPHEDFGIVAVEAQAAGLPVVALGAGGALDTVRDGVTGVLASAQTAEQFSLAIEKCMAMDLSSEACRAHAWGYRPERFQANMRAIASDAIERFPASRTVNLQSSFGGKHSHPGPQKVAVGIASLGRPENVKTLLRCLSAQTMAPHIVVLSVESENDVPEMEEYTYPVTLIYGERGLCAQRNRVLDALEPDVDVVVFYDDDFVPSRHSVQNISDLFAADRSIVGADGLVLADGITGPGIGPERALEMVDRFDADGARASKRIINETHGLYGCNMAYRVSALQGIRFDERLPLYGWLEDLDFGGQIPGALVHTEAFAGVHCGAKNGRERSGLRVGYSQVANPIYMVSKGTLPIRVAIPTIAKNLLANHARILSPEPWMDRRGRTVGNWSALRDLVLGRLDPERILLFSNSELTSTNPAQSEHRSIQSRRRPIQRKLGLTSRIGRPSRRNGSSEMRSTTDLRPIDSSRTEVERLAERFRDLRTTRGPGFVAYRGLDKLSAYVQYPVRKKQFAGKGFTFDGRHLEYDIHHYNATWRNERCVEVAVARHYLDKWQTTDVLEVGHVLHYYGITGHTVLDKYEESPGLIREDLLDYKPVGKYSGFVAISTFEHIGWDEPGQRSGVKLADAFGRIGDLLDAPDRALVTCPLGYNRFLDSMLESGDLPFDRTICLVRTGPGQAWTEVDQERALWSEHAYSARYPGANSLLVGVGVSGTDT